MKRTFGIILFLALTVVLSGCNQAENIVPVLSDNSTVSDNYSAGNDYSVSSTQSTKENTSNNMSSSNTEITLSIGNEVLEGYLNDSTPAQSLISQLPLTVTLNDSDNDFCGDNIDIKYSESDVTSGYKNGDLAFWTPANNFVIFVSGEENSANTGDLVKLGRITSPQKDIDALEGRIEVTIALKNENSQVESTQEDEEMKIKITVGNKELFATLDNNSTTKALVEKMPMTLSMSDLYGREMCYRYGAGAFPTDDLRSDGYEVGDIAYWPPRGSLVILYKQNGECFERQHLGHIDSGVEIFENTGDIDVTFELAAG